MGIGGLYGLDDQPRWLTEILESSDDAIVSKDLNGVVMSRNKAAEAMFGYTADGMIGQPIIRIIPPALIG